MPTLLIPALLFLVVTVHPIPVFAISARNFDCYEFGVVTIGDKVSAPNLQLFGATYLESSGTNWYVLKGDNFVFSNGPGGPFFDWNNKKVPCKYI